MINSKFDVEIMAQEGAEKLLLTLNSSTSKCLTKGGWTKIVQPVGT